MGISYALKLIRVTALTHVLPPISTFRFAHLCRSRPRGSILAATHRGFAFYVACPTRSIETRSFSNSLAASLAVLPALLFFPKAPVDLSVFPSMSLASSRLHSFVARTSLAVLPRSFTFYVADPINSIDTR